MMDTRRNGPAPAPMMNARAVATCLIGGIGQIVPATATAGNVVACIMPLLPFLPLLSALAAGGAA